MTCEAAGTLDVYVVWAPYYLAVTTARGPEQAINLASTVAIAADGIGWAELGHARADVTAELIKAETPQFVGSHNG
jgi:hypothetical protein